MRWTVCAIIVAVCAAAWVLAWRHDTRGERRWLDERAAEGDWEALERWRWHTRGGIRLLVPERLPEAVERQYMAALDRGEHAETMHC